MLLDGFTITKFTHKTMIHPSLPPSPPSLLPLSSDDLVGDIKKLIAAQTGTRPEKIRLQKWHTVFKDHITLEDYEVHDGANLELYYN